MADATTTTKTATANQYEGMFLLGQAATQENNGGLDLVRGMIERHGGQIQVLKKWDERKLAYEVNKQKRGTYVIAYFTAGGAAVTTIERDVKLSDAVLRVMITRADHLNVQEMEAVEPQPIAPPPERPSWETERYGGGGGYGGRRDDRGPRNDDRGPREGRGPAGPRREEASSAPAGAGAAGDAKE